MQVKYDISAHFDLQGGRVLPRNIYRRFWCAAMNRLRLVQQWGPIRFMAQSVSAQS